MPTLIRTAQRNLQSRQYDDDLEQRVMAGFRAYLGYVSRTSRVSLQAGPFRRTHYRRFITSRLGLPCCTDWPGIYPFCDPDC